MSKTRRFWDRMAARYFRQPIADEETYRIKLKITREYLTSDMTVFEFGCGTGGTAIAHAPFIRHIEAIDISSKMLSFALQQAQEKGIKNISFMQSDIESYEAPDESYDAILGLSILHLVKDKDATIAKVKAMLKPGGVFISSTACIGDTTSIFKWLGPPAHKLGLLPVIRIFTARELETSMTKSGFKIVHQWQPAKGKAVFIVAEKLA